MFKLFPILIPLVFTVTAGYGQANRNKIRAETVDKNIQKYFYADSAHLYKETNIRKPNENFYSFLWPLSAVLQCVQIQDANEKSDRGVLRVMQSIIQYYDTSAPASGYSSYVTRRWRSFL